MEGPPMGGPPGAGGPGGPGDVTLEDLLGALKQLPEELLRQLVSELMKFLGPGGGEEAPGPPGPPGGPGGPGLEEAARARAGV
jgi:hypothetical protein